MSSWFSLTGKEKRRFATPPPPTDAEAQAAAKAEAERLRKKRGFASTMVAGGKLGVTEEAEVKKATLGG